MRSVLQDSACAFILDAICGNIIWQLIMTPTAHLRSKTEHDSPRRTLRDSISGANSVSCGRRCVVTWLPHRIHLLHDWSIWLPEALDRSPGRSRRSRRQLGSPVAFLSLSGPGPDPAACVLFVSPWAKVTLALLPQDSRLRAVGGIHCKVITVNACGPIA